MKVKHLLLLPLAVTGVGLSAISQATILSTYQSAPNIRIPAVADATSGTAIDTITIAESMMITDLTVDLWVSHSWVADLGAMLVRPGGDSGLLGVEGVDFITLFDRPGSPEFLNGCEADNIGNGSGAGQVVNFSDSGASGGIEDECSFGGTAVAPGSYQAYLPGGMSAFDGMDIMGDWQLKISDFVLGDVGTFHYWAMNVILDDMPAPAPDPDPIPDPDPDPAPTDPVTDPTQVPEPAPWTLFSLGLLALCLKRFRH